MSKFKKSKPFSRSNIGKKPSKNVVVQPRKSTSIQITRNTTDKEIDDLRDKGYWFFQSTIQDKETFVIRTSVRQTKEAKNNPNFWKGKDWEVKIIARKPPGYWKNEPNMREYYHATDPSRVQEILEEGFLSSEAYACNKTKDSGLYVASSPEEAFGWGLTLYNEGEILERPVVLKVSIPSCIEVVDDPNPIEKNKYPDAFIVCTEHGIPKDFVTLAYPLNVYEGKEADRLFDEYNKLTTEEDEY